MLSAQRTRNARSLASIQVSPSARLVLLGWFPALRSRFQVSHHATYCTQQSLASYLPVVHMCSHFGARVCRRHVLCETTHAQQQVPQHVDSVQTNGSLFSQAVALISFTLYGADQRTQESKPNYLRNQDFLNFCLVGPHICPEGFEFSATQYVDHDD